MAWKWNPARRTAALLRSQGQSWAEVAAGSGMARSTAEKLALEPAFTQHVQELLDAEIGAALDVLKRAAVQAAETLVGKLDVSAMTMSEAKTHDTELAAAEAILSRLGVTAANQSAPLQLTVSVDVDVSTLAAAERAYLDALRQAAGPLDGGLLPGDASGAGYPAVHSVSVSGQLPAGPEPG